MLNDLLKQLRQYAMLQAGDRVNCAVSGGADSMALLWGLYLLKDKLKIDLAAVHFNHCLRGEESDADEAFVREFCSRFEIPLVVGKGCITPGKKRPGGGRPGCQIRIFCHTLRENCHCPHCR